MSTKNKALKGSISKKHFDTLIYTPNEYSNTYPNPIMDKEVIAILQDKPSTLLQLEPFFPNQLEVLRMRLTDLCSKGVLRQVYNGHIYYQLKKEMRPQITIKKGNKIRVFDLSVLPTKPNGVIPKGYTHQDYMIEKLELPKTTRLSFRDGKFRNLSLQE